MNKLSAILAKDDYCSIALSDLQWRMNALREIIEDELNQFITAYNKLKWTVPNAKLRKMLRVAFEGAKSFVSFMEADLKLALVECNVQSQRLDCTFKSKKIKKLIGFVSVSYGTCIDDYEVVYKAVVQKKRVLFLNKKTLILNVTVLDNKKEPHVDKRDKLDEIIEKLKVFIERETDYD